MSHSLSASKNTGHSKKELPSTKQSVISDEKASSMPNLDDCSRPTSAPPKLYSGSLFLYTNDPFGCFTKEHQEVKEEEPYNKFFNYAKQPHQSTTLQKSLSYSLGDTDPSENKGKHSDINPIAEAKSDLDISDMLSRQNSSLVDGRLSPDRFDASASKVFMEVFEEGFNLSDAKDDHSKSAIGQNSSSRNDVTEPISPPPTNHNQKKAFPGEQKNKSQKKAKGQHNNERHEENQSYGHAMTPPPMGYMPNAYPPQANQPYVNMHMMTPEFHYMMNNSQYRQPMPGYPMPAMEAYPYGAYPPQDAGQAPKNYENNTKRGTGNANKNDNNTRKSKNDGKNKDESNKNKKQGSNSNNNTKKKDKEKKHPNEENKSKSEKSGNSQTKQSTESQNTDPNDVEKLIESASKLAKDQAGCRMLQKQLELNDQEVTYRIFDQVIGDFASLMVDPFGNYLCQKLTESCSLEQMEKIIEAASSSLTNICFDPHGTRAVQKLIEIVKDQKLIDMIVKYLSRDVVGLIKDNNGNHVVQKCLTNMSDKNKQFIYDSITENCIEIATHKHGCCVIQRCLDHASRQQKNDLVDVVINHTPELVQDQYGNYVVQYVLELKDTEPGTNDRIAETLSDDIVELCKQKFSSNVIEKCLYSNLASFKENFMDTLAREGTLVELICDQFGNYVLQRFLANASEQEAKIILQGIADSSEAIKNDAFGFKIYAKLAKTYSILNDEGSKSNPPHSPLISEGSTNHSNRTRGNSAAQSKKSTNSNSNRKNSDNKKNSSNKNDKRSHHNTHTNNNNNRGHRNNYNQNNNSNNNVNFQQGYPMPQYGHPVAGPMMYPHPMRPDMMAPPNMVPGVMYPEYYMANPQMYNQYYGYPHANGPPGLYYGNKR